MKEQQMGGTFFTLALHRQVHDSVVQDNTLTQGQRQKKLRDLEVQMKSQPHYRNEFETHVEALQAARKIFRSSKILVRVQQRKREAPSLATTQPIPLSELVS
jgi:hypothetical protein